MNAPVPKAPKVAMILAAGFGTRMGALTATRPKPLLEVGGAALIDRAVDLAAAAGVERAVVNLHYKGEMIRAHLVGRAAPEIAFSEEPEILETGGGVVHAAPLLGDAPFFTINADALWPGGDPLAALIRAWDPARMDALLHLAPRAAAIAYTRPGDFALDLGAEANAAREGACGPLVRRGAAATAPYVFTGAQIISPEALAGAPDGAFSLNVVWDALLARGRLFGVVGGGSWVDVGTPEGLAAAEAAL